MDTLRTLGLAPCLELVTGGTVASWYQCKDMFASVLIFHSVLLRRIMRNEQRNQQLN